MLCLTQAVIGQLRMFISGCCMYANTVVTSQQESKRWQESRTYFLAFETKPCITDVIINHSCSFFSIFLNIFNQLQLKG